MPKQKPIEPEDIPTRAGKRKIFKSEQAKKKADQKEYIPLIDPKQTTEVFVKPKPSREEIEHIEKPGKTIKKSKRKTSSSKIKELEGNSILIITEKPQAASKISAALSGGRARQSKSTPGVFYYEFQKNNENIIIACAVGHLFSLSQDVKGSNYPIFDISWKPNFEVRKKDFTRKYYTSIKKLIKRAKEIVIATDYDVEGEVIGYNIIRYIANQPDAKRMKFSSLTVKDLEEAYNNLQPTIDWGQALGGETRHYLDWFYGINLSRALMNSIKTTGRFKIMSIGRVQGPTLKLIVDKEKEISSFKPTKFWKIFINVHEKQNPENKLRLKHIKDIEQEKELEKFKALRSQEAEMSTKKTEKIIPPPTPFDLTSLQTEVYKFHGITPSRTLQIAQQLYLAGIISYPRTSSQKIPESINPKHILKRLNENFPTLTKHITRTKPIEGKKSDPAHPSIYPTGEFQTLSGDDKKVYELIVKRFISCFCQDAKTENKTITAITKDNLKFRARGLEIIEKAWMSVYPVKLKEQEIQDMETPSNIDQVDIEEDLTKPPKRFSPASIISELEKRGLGTKATRANIIETLYNRNYIADNKSIKATSLGINIIDTLEKYSPIIIDEKLTREIEADMEKMHTAKNKTELTTQQQQTINKSKKAIEKISKDFQKNESKIGKEIIKATEEAWKQEAKENELDFQCPVCKKESREGKLTIKYSPRFKRKFIACNAYPNCKTTYTLPPNSLIKKTDKICEHCQFPLLMSLKKARKPWIFCFNPECPGRLEREKQKQQEQ